MVNTDDLILRYGMDNVKNLATDANDNLDLDLLNSFLQDAKNIVSSYVGELNHPVFKSHILIIAYYFLERERATDKARLDYEDSLKFLKLVSEGKIKIGAGSQNTTGGQDCAQSQGSVIFKNQGSIFRRQ